MSESSSDMVISQVSFGSEPSNSPEKTPLKSSFKRTLTNEASPPNRYTPTAREKDSYDFFAHRRAVKKMKMDEAATEDKSTDFAEVAPKLWKLDELKEGKYVNEKLIFRVTWVSARVKEDKNGHLFIRFIAMDQSGKIQCAAFRDNAKRIFNQLEVGKTYEMTGFHVEVESPDPKFNPLGNQFKITLQDFSKLEPIVDASSGLPGLQFDFKTFRELNDLPKGTRADFLGIMVKDWEKEYRTISNKPTLVRDISFVDSEDETQRFTFYEEMAEDFVFKEFVPVVLGNILVNEYMDRSSIKKKNFRVYGTSLVINPATGDQAEALQMNFLQKLDEAD